MVPHPSKREKGGEDAYVAAHDLMVVADGVGGWARSGIDPGLFSKQLVADFFAGFASNNAQDMKELLATSVENNKNIGTCTFCAARFDTTRDNYLKTINLGDSGYLLVRPNPKTNQLDTLFRTKEQQKGFNFPVQCGTNGDHASTADSFEHEIQDDDILIMASDGVLDNMFDNDLKDCVLPQMDGVRFLDPQETAYCIALKSFELGSDPKYNSPFAIGAQKAGR